MKGSYDLCLFLASCMSGKRQRRNNQFISDWCPLVNSFSRRHSETLETWKWNQNYINGVDSLWYEEVAPFFLDMQDQGVEVTWLSEWTKPKETIEESSTSVAFLGGHWRCADRLIFHFVLLAPKSSVPRSESPRDEVWSGPSWLLENYCGFDDAQAHVCAIFGALLDAGVWVLVRRSNLVWVRKNLSEFVEIMRTLRKTITRSTQTSGKCFCRGFITISIELQTTHCAPRIDTETNLLFPRLISDGTGVRTDVLGLHSKDPSLKARVDAGLLVFSSTTKRVKQNTIQTKRCWTTTNLVMHCRCKNFLAAKLRQVRPFVEHYVAIGTKPGERCTAVLRHRRVGFISGMNYITALLVCAGFIAQIQINWSLFSQWWRRHHELSARTKTRSHGNPEKNVFGLAWILVFATQISHCKALKFQATFSRLGLAVCKPAFKLNWKAQCFSGAAGLKTHCNVCARSQGSSFARRKRSLLSRCRQGDNHHWKLLAALGSLRQPLRILSGGDPNHSCEFLSGDRLTPNGDQGDHHVRPVLPQPIASAYRILVPEDFPAFSGAITPDHQRVDAWDGRWLPETFRQSYFGAGDHHRNER